MQFGDILKQLRDERDLKQEDLAKYLNVDRSTVGKWESSPSKPDYEKLIKIADFFNVSIDFLLGTTQTRNSNKEDLTDNEIINLAAHKIGHEGELSEEELEKVKLAIQIALMKHKR